MIRNIHDKASYKTLLEPLLFFYFKNMGVNGGAKLLCSASVDDLGSLLQAHLLDFAILDLVLRHVRNLQHHAWVLQV